MVKAYTGSDRFVIRIKCTLGSISSRSLQAEHACCQIATTAMKQLLSVCAKYGNFPLHVASHLSDQYPSVKIRVCEILCDSERYIAHSSNNDLLSTFV